MTLHPVTHIRIIGCNQLIFRYPQDRLPVILILLLSALDFCLYFLVDNTGVLIAYFFLMVIPKLNICAWNHHHQHLNTFRNKPLNRILEFFYALHTGITTNGWVLHHVLGHHHNFLDQTKDESRWKRKNGTVMGEIEYAFNVAATAYPRSYQVGKSHPKVQKDFILYGLLSFILVGLLVWFKPTQGLLLFVLPVITGLVLTAWVTYDHHAGLDTDNEFEASYNNLNKWYNLFTGNLGYHTAHHHKQGVHWSLLPNLHEKIKDEIPPSLIHNAITT